MKFDYFLKTKLAWTIEAAHGLGLVLVGLGVCWVFGCFSVGN